MFLDVAIQIVNYNTKKYLPDCFNGVVNDLKNSELSYKILVLDNDSQDNLSDLEEKYKSENIEFFCSDKNLGFGAGQNLLSKKAESKFILILNPDIKFLEKETIRRLLDKLKEFLDAKIVGPRLITAKNETQRWDHGEIKGWWAWAANHIGRSYWKERSEAVEVAWISGSFLLIERKIFEKLGGFDEKFFLYKEEEDLCLRIRKLGFKVIYEPKISIMHCGTENKKSEFMEKSQKYFLEKHFKNKFYYPILKLIAKIV